MKTILALVLVLAALPVISAPATPSHRAAIDRLFKVLKMDEQYQSGMLAGFEAGAGMSADRLASLPEAERAKVQQGLTKVKARMVELMGWQAVKADMTELYAKHFSEAETEAITKMMETPTGQLLISKQLILLPDAMAVGQKKAMAVMPEIMKIMQEQMQ